MEFRMGNAGGKNGFLSRKLNDSRCHIRSASLNGRSFSAEINNR